MCSELRPPKTLQLQCVQSLGHKKRNNYCAFTAYATKTNSITVFSYRRRPTYYNWGLGNQHKYNYCVVFSSGNLLGPGHWIVKYRRLFWTKCENVMITRQTQSNNSPICKTPQLLRLTLLRSQYRIGHWIELVPIWNNRARLCEVFEVFDVAGSALAAEGPCGYGQQSQSQNAHTDTYGGSLQRSTTILWV